MVYVCKTWQNTEPKACKTTWLDSTVSDQWSAGGRASCRSFYCVFLSLHLWQVQWTSEARASATTHFSYWCQLLLSLSSQRMSGKMFFFPWFPQASPYENPLSCNSTLLELCFPLHFFCYHYFPHSQPQISFPFPPADNGIASSCEMRFTVLIIEKF